LQGTDIRQDDPPPALCFSAIFFAAALASAAHFDYNGIL
jgi:hypothetical protein